MNQTAPSPGWVHGLACATVGAALFLIAVGGVVTSKGVGLAVPDWPTSYGYNMFALPWPMMVGGVFWEHGHRLVASGVGLMTVALAVGLGVCDRRAWMRWLGLAAVALVIGQGVLGGLRVVWLENRLGIVHACAAQVFLGLASFLALATSGWWARAAGGEARGSGPGPRTLGAVTALIFVQLVLGASMRHAHAGLAVPDFPLAYGRWWPETGPAAMEAHNAWRAREGGMGPTTAGQVRLHMAHRLAGLGIVGALGWVAWRARGRGVAREIRRGTWAWAALGAAQFGLGAWTVWSGKAADVATAHVAVGSALLASGCVLTAMRARLGGAARGRVAEA